MVKKGICKKSGLPCGKCMAGVLDDVMECQNLVQEEQPKEKSEDKCET